MTTFSEAGRRGAASRWQNHKPATINLRNLGLTPEQCVEAARMVREYAQRVRGDRPGERPASPAIRMTEHGLVGSLYEVRNGDLREV